MIRAGLPLDVDECAALNAVVTFPADGVVGFTPSSSFGVESSSHGTVRKAFR
jgi:hypothetical protein